MMARSVDSTDTVNDDRPPRVALVTLGDAHDPGSYSGLPHGLSTALLQLGVGVEIIAGRLDGRVEASLIPLFAAAEFRRPDRLGGTRHAYWLARQRAQDGLLMSEVRSARAARGVKSHRDLDLVIQHGSELDLGPLRVPLVTYEDSTLDAALRVRQHYRHLDRAVARTIETARHRSARTYGRAASACFTSSWAAHSAIDDYGLPTAQVRVVGVGRNVDTGAVSHDWSQPVYLWIGREWVRKGGPQTVQAFQQVRQRHPNATLHLVGRHPEVSIPGVVGHGELDLGRSETAPLLTGLYAMATCLVLPSLHEPSATVFAEAAAAGIGSIGSLSGGSATIIGDGGIVVPPDDVTSLVTAMEQFAEPETAREMGKRSQARSSLFTWEAVARRLIRASGINGDTIPDGDDFLPLD
jgi:glycosyltransferase involved in cell wall biosynthesis